MALQPLFEVCTQSNCTAIKFTETTGVYSTSNTGGYGAPNTIIGDIVSAVLIITDPSNNEYTIDLFTQGFPSSNSSYSYIITADSLGLDSIEDGKWTFMYYVSTLGTTYFKSKFSLLFCNSACCVNQMLANLELGNCACDCDSVSYKDYTKAWVHLEALKASAKCGDTTLFAKLKKIVDKLCLNSGCKTCK